MALLETLTIGVGAAVANSALKLWLKDSEIAAAAATSVVDILAKKLPFAVRRPAQREFDRIAEEVGRNLERFLDAESPHLPQNEKEAAALAVAGALDRATITDDLLFAKNLDPLALERHVLTMVPNGDRDVSGGLYAKILRESCSYVIEITSTLPGFGLRAIQETLQREGEIASLVKQVLEAMPLSKGAGAGDESDEAFESQYRQNVARELDRLQLFGITTERVSPRYGLSIAYITLSAARPSAPSSRTDAAPDDETDAAPDDDDDIDRVSIPVDEALAGSQRILVRGEAGSGKTTLLQWLAVQSARNAFTGALAEWNGLVSFFIQLRRWADTDLPQPEQWLTHIAGAIAGAMPRGWVHRQLRTGALVLIDGVDELPDTERERVQKWLQDLIANAEGARFIITSRPAAAEEGWLRGEGFYDSHLQAMELQQIEALIDQWHVAARKQLTDEDILASIGSYQESLKRVIQSDRAIRSLATSPLLCAMLCLLNLDHRTKIPKDRMALYRIALESLSRREALRETDWANLLELSERQRELALEGLAYWLIRNGRADARRAEAEGVIADTLPQLAPESARVVQYLLERSGLLREPVVDRIDFIHRTFQEYLAAKRIIAAQDVGILLSHAHERTWREVVILATGHASDRCEIILKGLLERADNEQKHRHYLSLLAVSCLETATAFSDQTRRAIQNRLAELVPPKTITEAKAIASAGEIALPYLANHTKSRAQHAAACVRALAMIGGDAALGILAYYASDVRQRVSEEIFRAGMNFDFDEYTRRILSRRSAVRLGPWVEHLAPLASLTALRSLSLWECRGVTDLSPLAGLTALQSLSFGWCNGLTDLTPLAGLTALQSLSFRWCKGLTDLTPLAGLTALQSLELSHCAGAADLAPLARLTALQTLDLSGCEGIHDLSPLAGLTELRSLNLGHCKGVREIKALTGLTALRSLNLAACPDLKDLTSLVGLTSLQSLHLWGCNGVTDLNPLAGLTTVRSLFLNRCAGVTDVTPLAGLIALQSLHLSECAGVTDLTPLGGLTGLRSLNLRHCKGVTELAPLAGLTALRSLHLEGCEGVTDLTPLASLRALRAVLVTDESLIEKAPPGLRPRVTASSRDFWRMAS